MVKVFHSAKLDEDLDPVDATNELLEEMKFYNSTVLTNPLRSAPQII